MSQYYRSSSADLAAHSPRATLTSSRSSTGPGTSNEPAEAINGPLGHLRGSAPGSRYLTNYLFRPLLESGGFEPQLHR